MPLALSSADLLIQLAMAKNLSILTVDCPCSYTASRLNPPSAMHVGTAVAVRETHLPYASHLAADAEFDRLELALSDLCEQNRLNVTVRLRVTHADGSYRERSIGEFRHGFSEGSPRTEAPTLYPVV